MLQERHALRHSDNISQTPCQNNMFTLYVPQIYNVQKCNKIYIYVGKESSDFSVSFSASTFFCFNSHKLFFTNLLAASLLMRGISVFLSFICFARIIAFFNLSFSNLIRCFDGSIPVKFNDIKCKFEIFLML